jgi:micrococcal nuclease
MPAAAAAGVGTECVDPPVPTSLRTGRVTEITDGDTIRMQLLGGQTVERVRLIGIDSPEQYPSEKLDRDAARTGRSREALQELGRRATAYAERTLADQVVGLSFDAEPRDRYRRLLAYVWLQRGALFNRLIVADGYAQVLTVPPNVRYAGLFLACQREARKHRRGLWGR